jgi:tRNA 2-thiouridine synthesizing protein A
MTCPPNGIFKTMAEHTLDCRRLLCPLPVIRTQNKIKQMQHGEELLVIASDPGVKADIPAWCRINGHLVLSIEESATPREIRIHIRCQTSV